MYSHLSSLVEEEKHPQTKNYTLHSKNWKAKKSTDYSKKHMILEHPQLRFRVQPSNETRMSIM